MAPLSENDTDRDFKVLGLPADASPAEVKKAYRELVKRWHPDRFHQQSALERRKADERIKEITGAYHRISKEWANRKRTGATEGHSEETAQPSAGKSSTRHTSAPRPASSQPNRIIPRIRTHYQRLSAKFRSRSLKGQLLSLGAFAAVFVILLAITSLMVWLPFPFTGNPGRSIPESGPRVQGWPPREDPQGKQPPGEPPPAAEGNAAPQDQPGRAPPSADSSDLDFFTLGSSQADVLRIQGPPSRVHGQVWVYGLSEIQFREGRLARYNNFDGSLRIRLQPQPNTENSPTGYFTIGSSENDVLLAQGTPSRVEAGKWHYGFSEIQFKSGRVQGFQNYYGNLHVLMLPVAPSTPAAAKGYFTVGASSDDVLSVQGTPTSVQGNVWRYESSTVLFREGKVHYVINSDANLRFVPLEDINGKGKESG